MIKKFPNPSSWSSQTKDEKEAGKAKVYYSSPGMTPLYQAKHNAQLGEVGPHVLGPYKAL